jgi:hypothetical protein
MPSFEFADCPTRINLTVAADTQAQAGSLACTIRNTTARRQTGRIRVEPIGGAQAEWFSLTEAHSTSPREIEQDFAANGTLTIQVAVKVPPKTPPGSQTFRLRVTSETAPDTDYAEGPAVALEIAPFVEPAAPSKTVVPWWAFAVIGLFIVLVLGAVIWLAWPTTLDPKLVVGKPFAEAAKIAEERGFRGVKAESGDTWGNDPAKRIVVGVRDAGRTLQVDDGVTLPATIIQRPFAQAAQMMLDLGVLPAPTVLGQVMPGMAPGTVIITAPPPGAPIAMGTPVLVTVAALQQPPFALPGQIIPCNGMPTLCGVPLRSYTTADLNAVARERLAKKDKMVEIILGQQ